MYLNYDIINTSKKGEQKMKLPVIKTLEKATNEIHKLETSSKKNLFTIANILVEVKTRELYKEEGFKTVSEYAAVKLGYKKSTVYKLTSVSERFLKGQDKSILVGTTDDDFSLSQLSELIPLTDEVIREKIDTDEINTFMSSKKIRDFVKSFNDKALEVKDEWVVEKHQSEEPNDEVPFKENDKSSLANETNTKDGYCTDKTAKEEAEEDSEEEAEEDSEEVEEDEFEDVKTLKDRIIKVKSIIRAFEKNLIKKNEISSGDVFAFLQVIENGLNGFI